MPADPEPSSAPPSRGTSADHSTNAITATLGVGTSSGRRRGSALRWLLGLAVLTAVGAGLYFWQFRAPPPPAYRFDTVALADIRSIVTATGTLRPVDQITVGAEVSGRVDDILVDFNDRVSKGQVLARLNTDELQAREVQTRAGVAQARANLGKAELDLRRADELRPRGFVSREQYEQVRTSLLVARAAFDSAQALADQARANLAKAAIRSPIDGVVLDRKIERGQTVAASFQTPELFVIASDLERLELTVDIDEADIGEVRTGQQASFQVDAYGDRVFAAQLVELRNAARTVANVVTYQGVLSVDNRAGLLRPGMTATADVVVRTERGVPTITNRALRFQPADGMAMPDNATPLAPGLGRLWQLGPEGELRARRVQLGGSDGRRTRLLGDAVRLGERFVIDADRRAGSPGSMPRVRIRP